MLFFFAGQLVLAGAVIAGFLTVIFPVLLVDVVVIGSTHLRNRLIELAHVIEHFHGDIEVVELIVGPDRRREKGNHGQCQGCDK